MRPTHRRRLAVLSVAVTATTVSAADNHYSTGGAGNWQDPAKWTRGTPSSSDSGDYLDWPSGSSVLINSVTTTSFPASLSINALTITGPSALTIDSTASASVPLNTPGGFIVDGGGSLNLAGGAVTAASFDAGFGSAGSVVQSGASTFTIGGDLHLGRYAGAGGTYTLNGGTLSVSSAEYVGEAFSPYNAIGTFTQNGGAHSVGNGLNIGNQDAGSGTYTLNGGTLNITNAVDVGNVGTFNQTGGTLTLANGGGYGQLQITGRFNLSQANASNPAVVYVPSFEYIGTTSGSAAGTTGVVTQNGGSNTITGNLTLARNAGSSAVYILNGGTLNASNNCYVAGDTGAAGGTATLSINGGTATIGSGTGTGTVHVWQGGTFNIAAGGTMVANTLVNDGVINNFGGSLQYTGTITGSGKIYNSTGTLTWSNGAAIDTQDVTITGGTAVANGSLLVGKGNGSTGILIVTGGSTTIHGTLGAGNTGSIGSGSGTGMINLSGGTTYADTILLGSGNGGTGSVAVSGTGVLNVGSAMAMVRGGSLSITGTGRVNLMSPGNNSASTIMSFAVAGGGKLDIGSTAVDFPGGDLSVLTGKVMTGFNGGTWTGPGITSSVAGVDTRHLTAVGVLLNDNGVGGPIYTLTTPPDPKRIGLFKGSSPGFGDVLIAYTYFGDANLDGKIDGSDYSLIDAGLSAHATGWSRGDFNYDGTVDGSDYGLLDNTYNRQGASLTPAAVVAAVPEPGCMVAVALVVVARRSRARPAVS